MAGQFSNESVVRDALRDPSISILSIRGADALTRLFPILSKIVMPQGVIDYERNVPAADVTLRRSLRAGKKSLLRCVGNLIQKTLFIAFLAARRSESAEIRKIACSFPDRREFGCGDWFQRRGRTNALHNVANR